MRVLVVEDEADLADAIARGLRREGYAVDVAYDGDAALDKIAVNAYDVVCLDLNLPGTAPCCGGTPAAPARCCGSATCSWTRPGTRPAATGGRSPSPPRSSRCCATSCPGRARYCPRRTCSSPSGTSTPTPSPTPCG